MNKRFLSLIAALLILAMLGGCTQNDAPGGDQVVTPSGTSSNTDLGDDDTSYGEVMEGLYNGYFADQDTDEDGSSEDTTVSGLTITCEEGSADCYTLENGTLTFTQVSENSVYSLSGQFQGNIVIDIGDDFDFDLELRDFSMISNTECPIAILSGDEVAIKAKSDTINYIYDTREAVDSDQDGVYAGAIHSKVDLKIAGKGTLTVVSENNNGIHSKKDLEVKNLTLTVWCKDNALKGNDSVTVTDATTTLVATAGDGIKTSDTDISSKGNQRGTITISGGEHTIYAACDGLDAAYDVVIDNDDTLLNIYTDKYSNYSEEVTAVDGDYYYIRFTSKSYSYVVTFYNSDEDYVEVDAEYHSSVSGGRTTYYYYCVPRLDGYEKIKFTIVYSGGSVSSDYLTPSSGYDTFALIQQGNSLGYQWTNYTTTVNEDAFGPGGGGHGGGGGMDSGNTNKGDHSTKGIKAGNAVSINGGTINVKSYDDCIHTDQGTTLENGETSLGNITISGGALTLYSMDDGIHADNTLTIDGGSITVTNCYEGLEGTYIFVNGGEIFIEADDDGVNGTATSGTAITINGGYLYIYCTGDGLDSNSKTKSTGIIFNGGTVISIANSSGNSSIDTENGYTYNGGVVLAIMPTGGMTSEATNGANFSKIGTKATVSLSAGAYLTVTVNSTSILTIQIPVKMSAFVVYLGSSSAKFSTSTSTTAPAQSDGGASL